MMPRTLGGCPMHFSSIFASRLGRRGGVLGHWRGPGSGSSWNLARRLPRREAAGISRECRRSRPHLLRDATPQPGAPGLGARREL